MRYIIRLKTERELVRIKIHDGNAFWNEIRVNAGLSKLMLLSLNLLLPVLVYATRHSLTILKHKLMLPGITSYYWLEDDEGIVCYLLLPFCRNGRMVAEKEVSAADPVTIAGEVVTTANVEVTTANAPKTTIDELTLAQTLIEIKAAKPKAVTTTTTIRLKAKGVVVQEPSKFKTTSSPLQASPLPQAKDKGKAIMVKPEKPLKKKDQIALDEEVARNLEAQLQIE
ncbi:hypothetical protein Tco_1402802 [Tanacetum coccineum]